MSAQTLTDAVAFVAGVPKTTARTVVNTMISEITDGLAAVGEVRIAGLGTFRVKAIPAHPGRDPRTGETIEIAAQCKVRFKPAKALRAALNPPPAVERRRN